jgi:pimeloyl-ACP methyl ester carboxylesterase
VANVDLDGLNISYRDSGGEGTPVVLVHGFPFDFRLWDPQFEALGSKYRLIAPDLRGFGHSSPPPGGEDFSMEAFAADIARLLDRLRIEEVIFGGLSMGGYVTFEFLRQNPHRTVGLILADTRSDADSPEVRAKREAQQDQIAALGGASLVDGMVAALLSEETRSERPEVAAQLRTVMEQDDRAWTGGLEAMKNRPDSTDELSGLSAPTLILVGENDSLAPPDVARAMQERIPQSRVVVIEGAGHVSNLEQPAAFNAALETFLDEL